MRQLGRAGKLAGLTVIDDLPFAVEMADYVPYVVLRNNVATDHDGQGRGYVEYGADPRVILQFDNEWNNPNDNDYQIDLMKTADAHGRKVVIFNDSVGATELDTWVKRRGALEYAKAHGHYVGLHAYGIVTDGNSIYHPMTEESGWHWFAGRFEWLYSAMPPEAQPNLILTECGAGGFQRNATPEQWLADVRRMNEIAQRSPWLKSYNWWTAGGGGAMGFENDKLDDYIHLLA